MPSGVARHAPVANPAVSMLARGPRVSGKTRLTAHLEPGSAANLRRALLLDSVEAALGAGWPLHLFVTPDAEQQDVREVLAGDGAIAARAGRCHVHAQAPGDLGARMADAMHRTLSAGHDAVVLVGSDVPALPATALTDAVTALSSEGGDQRLVFGPASDGGFYLVAGKRAWPAAFADIEWGRDTVLADVCARARANGLDVAHVEPCDDVDVMADLERVLGTLPGHRALRTREWLTP